MKSAVGNLGEDYIAQWMQTQGYEIVARNYHSRFGEIDIIGQKGGYLVFVEVKAREQGSLVSPFEAITPQKRRRLLATAKNYLMRYPTALQPRFDAAAVFLKNGKVVEHHYIENVFWK